MGNKTQQKRREAREAREREIDADVRENVRSTFDGMSESAFRRQLVERLKPFGTAGAAIAKLIAPAEDFGDFEEQLAAAGLLKLGPPQLAQGPSSRPTFDELVSAAVEFLARARAVRDATGIGLQLNDGDTKDALVDLYWCEREQRAELKDGRLSWEA